MGKFDKYFITQTKPDYFHETYLKGVEMPTVDYPFAIDSDADGKVPGTFSFVPHIVVQAGAYNTFTRPHMHDFDEYLAFLSLDPDDVEDLGGEVEFWIEDEPHTITKTTAVFVPKYVWHTPLIFKKVDRPFGWIVIGTSPRYYHLQFHPKPEYAKGFILDETAKVTLGGKEYEVTKSYFNYLEWMIKKGRANLGLKD